MRKWGQHFLIDEKIARREVEYAEITESDTVLEIGPGKGILTKILAERARKVIAIEIDKNLVRYLSKILPENVEIIHADVMDIDLKKIEFNKVVSNLPFEISSPITFKLLGTNFSKAVIIYQKEFARRIVAKPGSKDYSRLSVVMYYRAVSRILEIVPKSAFRPMPKVDGAIVEIIPRKSPPFFVRDENFFYEFLSKAFSNRRKTLGKIVKNYYGVEIDERFCKKRIEELKPEEIGELCNQILEKV
ncbi:MAG: ribosomal RNA small subunit methyltransferase A [Thermoplasmata archaeon]|nr:MAG: ribosomal RNA small subunit methyltransferase A [Thermoplasmata archaeon]